MPGKLKVQTGQKTKGYLPVKGCGYELPYTVISGTQDGPTVLVTAGVHNAEYVGIQAAIELADEISPENICGNLIIMPLINVSGFEHRTMSMTYEDHINLNRVFPGKADGTVGELICHTLTSEAYSLADYYIDLHCGDGYEMLESYVYYVGPVDPQVSQKAYEMARCVDVKYIVESQTVTGGGYNHASSMGIPSILLERGGRGIWSKEEVQKDKEDVLRILDYLYERPDESFYKKKQILFKDVVYECSQYTGFWYPQFQVGDRVRKGDILGYVKDVFANVLYVSEAEHDGVILYQVASLNVLEEGPMVTYGILQ